MKKHTTMLCLGLMLWGAIPQAFSVVAVYAADTTAETADVDSDAADDEAARAAQEEQDAKERAEAKKQKEKEEQQAELSKDQEKLKEKIEKAEDKKAESQAKLNAQRSVLMKQRYALAQIQEELTAKEEAIEHTSEAITEIHERVALHKRSLAALVRTLYKEQSTHAFERVLPVETTGSFSLVSDHTHDVRDRMIAVLATLASEENELTAKKQELDQERAAKSALEQEQKQKERALAYATSVAQSEVTRAQAEVSTLRAKLGNIQAKLSALLGEGISTDDIEEAAAFASTYTGVRKDFILGMLTVETDLGRFTGGCTYATSRMNDRRKKYFKQITKALDYDYKKMRVSCPPSQYTGTGGAMGVAQFMSDTWIEYEDRIAAGTGHNPPDPWHLVDGVMAMALKLANDGATNRSGEWNAAARYLGSCSGNTRFYCENVLYWAENYEKKL